MKFIKTKRHKFILITTAIIVFICTSLITTILNVPGEITLLEGEEYVYNIKSLFPVNIKADIEGIVKLNNDSIKGKNNFLKYSNPILMKTQKNGRVNLSMSLFGLIPIKSMQVDILSNKKLAACGNTVGVKLNIDGILVIGISDVETIDGHRLLPIKDTGIKPGDFLVEVNGKTLNGIDQLVNEIEKSNGNSIKIKYRQGNNYKIVDVTPVKSIDDKKYHIGLWVRDSTAGIGTLTFYDPETKCFGALGHGITDIDTGTLMPVKEGEILGSNILGVKIGKNGVPGELKGVFIENNKLGVINTNSNYGIYGQLNDDAVDSIMSRLYTVGIRTQIKEGPAKILSNVDGKTVEEYDIEIQKVSRQNLNGSKGMVIKITDKRLLEVTGGIVQGMSGSPIIQNDRIIGAVTHVLVNDPSRGYGIFIEGMLKNLAKNNADSLRKVG